MTEVDALRKGLAYVGWLTGLARKYGHHPQADALDEFSAALPALLDAYEAQAPALPDREAVAREVRLAMFDNPTGGDPTANRAERALRADEAANAILALSPSQAGGGEKDPGTIEHLDDGSKVYLDGYSGGGHPLGAWGLVTLRFIDPDGKVSRRTYRETPLTEDGQ